MPSSSNTKMGVMLGKHLIMQGRRFAAEPNANGNRAELRAAARDKARMIGATRSDGRR